MTDGRDAYMWKYKKYPEWLTPTQVWPTSGVFWKRRLSKARRRAFKQGRNEIEWECYRGLPAAESDCNYKTW